MKNIRAEMDPKALLDELMGKDRDLPFDQQKKKRLRFDDPEVFSLCKVSMLYACSLFRSPWCVVSAALNTFYDLYIMDKTFLLVLFQLSVQIWSVFLYLLLLTGRL